MELHPRNAVFKEPETMLALSPLDGSLRNQRTNRSGSLGTRPKARWCGKTNSKSHQHLAPQEYICPTRLKSSVFVGLIDSNALPFFD
jgi:hypothetical protein